MSFSPHHFQEKYTIIIDDLGTITISLMDLEDVRCFDLTHNFYSNIFISSYKTFTKNI